MNVHRKTGNKSGSHTSQPESQPEESHLLATDEHAPVGITEYSPEGVHINVDEVENRGTN